MLDAKFVCTISALVAALVAVCSFNSNQKMEIIEGYGNTPNGNTGFGAWQGGSQFSVYKSPAAVTTQVNGNPIVTNEQLKNGMFYSTVGLQQSLAPRASATSIYGALKNQSQAQTQQAANGPNGALPQNQGSTMSPNSNVSAAFLNTGTDNTITALNTEGAALVQSSNQFDQQQSMDLTQGVGVSSDGTVTYSMAKSYDQHQPNIEKFIVPGDKTKPCAGGCNRGPEFMADPVMDANYTNGNFNTMNESLLRPVAVQDIPIGTMRTINAGGDESNVLQLNRLVYANTKSRSRGAACLLRGDIVPQAILSQTQGGMFTTAQALRGAVDLGSGALSAMGGPGGQGSTVGQIITAQVAGKLGTTAAGSTYGQDYLEHLIGDDSTLAIQSGLAQGANVTQQAAAATALSVGRSQYITNNGSES